MTTIKDPEREAFEEWCADMGYYSLTKTPHCDAWAGWQAGAAYARSQTAEPVAFAYYWNPPECGGEEHSSLSWTRIADRDGKREAPLYAATPPEDAGK